MQVPEIFAPTVSQGEKPLVPASGPWVSPMRNAAPGQLQQSSQTLMQAGDMAARLGSTIGDRVQETMDDATTKAAETQFLKSALPVLGQYKTTEGVNATQLFDPTAQAISKARQEQRATLTNPVQQRMYDQVTNDHMLTFGQQMADHENVQRIQYGKAQGSDRADSMNVLARMAYLNGDTAGYQKYSGQADAETLGVAQLSGAAPDSDVAQAMLRAKRSDLAHGVMSGLFERNALNEADEYFAKVQPALDMRTAEALDSALKSMHRQEDPKIFGEQAIQAALGMKGPGLLQPPIPAGTISTTNGVDGIDIHTAQGTPVYAPASGMVTKVWMDDTMGRSVQVALPGGYTATFNGLAAVNYQEGQKITGGQVLGLTGKDDSGRGLMHYAMTDGDGKYIDPRQASSAPMDPKNFNTPQQEEAAVESVNANVADPNIRRLTEGYVRGIANMNRQIESQEHAAALKQATDYYLENGRSLGGLPADVRMKLTPEDIDSFSQETKAKNDVSLLASWIENPAGQTVDSVKKAYAQGRLSDAGYLTALRGAVSAADSGSPDQQKVIGVSVENEQIENTLLQNGHADIANAKTGSNQQGQKVALWGEIKDQIDAEQQVSRQPLTRDQKQKIIDSTILNSKFLKLPGWFGSVSAIAPWELKPDDAAKAQFTSTTGRTVGYRPITSAERAAATNSLIQRRVPITELNIYDTLVNAGVVK